LSGFVELAFVYVAAFFRSVGCSQIVNCLTSMDAVVCSDLPQLPTVADYWFDDRLTYERQRRRLTKMPGVVEVDLIISAVDLTVDEVMTDSITF